jgi:thiol-disulfide isomerase/thioredoxin
MCTRAIGIGMLMFAIVGLILVSAPIPVTAADLSAKALPRYQFKVGEQLNYKGQSDYKYENNSTITSADWRITVVDKASDGSYRLILRLATSYTRVAEGANQNQAKQPEEVFLATADLSPSGELKERFGSFGTRNVRNVLPMLPADAKQLANGWDSAGTFDSVLHSRRTSEEDGKFVFETVQEGAMNSIYGVEQHETVTFDMKLGRVDQVASTTQQTYGINSHGTGDLKYIGSKTLEPQAIKDLAADTDRFFAAKQTFDKASDADDATPAAFDKALADFKQARAGISTPEYQQQVDRLIEQFQKFRQYTEEQLKERAALIGQPAEQFKTTDLDGKPLALADLRGKVVLLDFWYRGCGWCIRSMPQLKEVAEHYQNKPVVLLGMNIDQKLDDAKFVVEKMGLTYPNLKAEGIPEKFKVHGYPTMIFIDRDGNIADVHVGWSATLKQDLIAKIDKLLDEKN